MPNFRSWSMARVAGLILVLGSVADFTGVWMFSIRRGAVGGPAATHSFFVTERVLIVSAVILTALGFVLLEGAFRDKNGHILYQVAFRHRTNHKERKEGKGFFIFFASFRPLR